MGRRQYSHLFRMEMDHRTGSRKTKRAEVLEQSEADERDASREGLRSLDSMIEANSALTRAAKDHERAVPRENVLPLGHEKKDRRLLEPDAVRVPMSKRQRLERLHAEEGVVRSLTNAQHRVLTQLTSDTTTWSKINQELGRNLGDAQELTPTRKKEVYRIDKAIQTYEAVNDRGHRVYANVRLPRGINKTNVDAFLANQLPDGTEVYFDQYTGSSHNLHEISNDNQQARDICVEIHTRRGMFIGDRGDGQSNGHLLPRGLKLEVAGVHEVTYSRPDGTRGRRTCVQLLDMTTPDQEEA